MVLAPAIFDYRYYIPNWVLCQVVLGQIRRGTNGQFAKPAAVLQSTKSPNAEEQPCKT